LYFHSFSVPKAFGTSEDFALPLSYPPLPRGDEGGCLSDYRQNKPFKYNAPPFIY